MTISPAVVVLDMNFSASCQVTPWPSAASVQWELNDKALLLRPRVYETDAENKTSVVQDQASERLAGRWTCEVTHQGEVWRASATLTVEGELVFLTEVQSLLLVSFFLFFFPTKDVLSDVLLGFFRDSQAPA